MVLDGASQATKSHVALALVLLQLPVYFCLRDLKLALGADFFNPSVVYYEGDYWISVREARFENESATGARWVNQAYLCIVDNSEFQDPKCHLYDPFEGRYSECLYSSTSKRSASQAHSFRPRFETTGVEDLKLFHWPGKGLYGVFGRKGQPDEEGSDACPRPVVFRQFLVKVGSYTAAKWDDVWNLIVPVPLSANVRYSRRTVKEKNWMPFIYSDELYFSYSVQPHKVLQVNVNGTATMKYLTSTPEIFANLPENFDLKWTIHGGPPQVFVSANMSSWNEDYYLGIFHYFHYTEGRKLRYRHFAFKTLPRPPFRVVGRSSELSLEFAKSLPSERAYASEVAYISGLDLKPDGMLLVSYGSADVEARLLLIKLHDIEALFRDGVLLTGRTNNDAVHLGSSSTNSTVVQVENVNQSKMSNHLRI